MNSCIFVNGVSLDSDVNAALLCLGSVSKDFSVDNMKKTRLYGYAYDFSVYYDTIDVDDILDIHKYLMKSMMWNNVYVNFLVFIVLLSFKGSLATKCVSLNNEPCMTRPTLIDFHSVELNFYSFMISLDKYKF